MMSEFVYVVEAQTNRIKVGVTRSLQSRLAMIHLHSPVLCRLIAFWQGNIQAEKAIHRRLEATRSHAEWFVIEGVTAEFVSEVRGRGVDVIPTWESITWEAGAERRLRGRESQAKAMRARWADPAFRENQASVRYERRARFPAQEEATA